MCIRQIVLITTIITVFLPGCSVFHHIFPVKEMNVRQSETSSKIRVKIRLNTGRSPAQIVKYRQAVGYKIVQSPVSEQWVITDMPIFSRPPEKAIRIKPVVGRLDKAVVTQQLFLPPQKGFPGKRIVKLPKGIGGNPHPLPGKSHPLRHENKGEESRLNQTLTVHFRINSSTLTLREMHKLRQFIGRIKGNCVGPVNVTGYTCWLGSRKYNYWLALDRAKTVAGVLAKAGIKLGRVKGRGNCCFIDPKRPGPNRRAEIVASDCRLM